MSTDDFSIRLKNIRDKYGCSQPKRTPTLNQQTKNIPQKYSGAARPYSAMKMSISQNHVERQMIHKPYEPVSKQYQKYDRYAAQKRLDEKSHEYRGSQQNRLSFGSSSFRMQSEGMHTTQPKKFEDSYKRSSNLQKQIDKIRQTYAADRKKVLSTFDIEYEQKNPRSSLYNDRLGLKPSTGLTQTYSRQKSYDIDSVHKSNIPRYDYTNKYENSVQKTYNPHYDDENASPIKRMNQFSPANNYKFQFSNDKFNQSVSKNHGRPSSSTYWRQKQAQLSQLTSNRLNELKYNEKNTLQKEYGLNRSHSRTGIKSQTLTGINRNSVDSPIKRKNHYDGNENSIMFSKQYTNKNDYSLSNIDRIQQRIQSIIGK